MLSTSKAAGVLAAVLLIIAVATSAAAALVTVSPDASVEYQAMLGVGGALTESAVASLLSLAPATRRATLRRLFDPTMSAFAGSTQTNTTTTPIGGNFGAIRLPIGACDFSSTYWTYDDGNISSSQPDYTMRNFSLAHSISDGTVRVLREILSIRADLFIIATPWSPPAFLKTSQSLRGGDFLVNSTRAVAAFAKYVTLYVEGMWQRFGVRIAALSLQNEPLFSTGSYPSMHLAAEDEATLARAVMLAFNKSATIRTTVRSKLLLYDHNWDVPQYPIDTLNAIIAAADHDGHEAGAVNWQQLADEWVAGAAFHCYAGDPATGQAPFARAFPNKSIFFTECSGGAWAPAFGPNLLWDTATLSIGSTVNGASTVLKWNLALDINAGPKAPGGCTNCRGIITVLQNATTPHSASSRTSPRELVRWEEDFVALAHLGAAMPTALGRQRPVVRRINVSTSDPSRVSAVSFVERPHQRTSQTNAMVTTLIRVAAPTTRVSGALTDIVIAFGGCIATLAAVPAPGVVTARFAAFSVRTTQQQCASHSVSWFVTDASGAVTPAAQTLSWRQSATFGLPS